jgi:hypothetical protein
MVNKARDYSTEGLTKQLPGQATPRAQLDTLALTESVQRAMAGDVKAKVRLVYQDAALMLVEIATWRRLAREVGEATRPVSMTASLANALEGLLAYLPAEDTWRHVHGDTTYVVGVDPAAPEPTEVEIQVRERKADA